MPCERSNRCAASDLAERDNHLRRDRALDQVRTGIYQSAIVMRDYLLAVDEKSGAAQIERFAETRGQTDQALAECASADRSHRERGPARIEVGAPGVLETAGRSFPRSLPKTACCEVRSTCPTRFASIARS